MTSSLIALLALGLAVQEPRTDRPATPVPDAQPASVVPTNPASIPVGTRVGELPTGYDDGHRRDPFASLIATRRTASPSTGDPNRPRTGLASLALSDVTVRGIVRSDKAMFAILEAPNKQSFVARVRDHLMDATVQSIDAGGVVFTEQNEGLGPVNQVRKALRPSGEEVR